MKSKRNHLAENAAFKGEEPPVAPEITPAEGKKVSAR
jgi:hypothetical protein